MPLYSPTYDLCGTNDVIVTKDSWRGQCAVLDWKTGKDYTFDQAIQVEMYRRFIEETTDFKIQKLAIVHIPKEPQRPVTKYIVKIDELENKFNQELKQWKKENKKYV